MTDLIARAREAWCEGGAPEQEIDLIPELPRELGLYARCRRSHVPCPPEVVAALLDALERLLVYEKSEMTLTVEAIMEKALEGKQSWKHGTTRRGQSHDD